MDLKFAKVRNVKTPVRGTPLSAGIDFFVPEFDKKFIEDLYQKNSKVYLEESSRRIRLYPHERILIPSGIHVDLTDLGYEMKLTEGSQFGPSTRCGIALIAHNKSGVATKKGLDRLAEVVDEDYQGEIHISIVNTGNENIYIEEGDKLIQFLLIPVVYADIKEFKFEDLYSQKTLRGSGGFGSTD